MNTGILTGLFVIVCGVAILWRWRITNAVVSRSNRVTVILMILAGVLMLAVAGVQ